MEITIPKLSLVVLIGPSGSGKSTFARKHFLPTEVLSSDFCRGLVSDDENDQTATNDAFELLHYVAGKRLARGRLTVVMPCSSQPMRSSVHRRTLTSRWPHGDDGCSDCPRVRLPLGSVMLWLSVVGLQVVQRHSRRHDWACT